MSLRQFTSFFTLSFFFVASQLFAQSVIWEENFSGAPPAPGWNENFTDCDGAPSSFNGVQNGRYEVIDMEGAPCCPTGATTGGANGNEWWTNDINIAGYCNVSISVDYGSVGTFECTAGGPFFNCTGDPFTDNGHDQMVFEYSIDGGAWVQFQYVCGSAPAGPATVSGLSGNTIRVRIMPANKSTAETYWFDNVRITGVLPTVNPINDVTACAGSPVSVTFTGTGPPPPTFQWTNDNTAIGLGASGTGNINFTPPVNLSSQQTATITVTPVSAGCSGTPETFTITVFPLPLTNDPPDIVACSGDYVEVNFSGNDPDAEYHWTVNNVPFFPPSGVGDISGTVPPLPFTISGSVTVRAVSNGCQGPPQTFNVTLHPAISATFSMVTPADICEGQPATFSINFSGGNAPYTFFYAIDGVPQPPINTSNDPHNFNVSLSSSATVSAISYINGNGCTADVSGEFAVNVIPRPTATLAPGPTDLCQGEALDLQISFNGSDDYTFTYAINGVPQPAVMATGPDYTLTVNPPNGTTTYTLTAVSSMGCTGTASGSHQAIVTPLPTALINGNPVICAGQNTSIPVTLSGSAPWTFVYSVNGEEQPPVTTSSSPFVITANYSASSTLELVSVSSGTCEGTVSGIAFVTVLPGVTGTLASGTNAICVGQSDTLRFTFSGAGPYTFTYTVNGVAQTPVTTPNTSFQIPVAPGVPTTYVLTSVSNGNCPGGSASGTYTVNVTDPPTAVLSVTGADTLCNRDSTILSVSFTGIAPWTFSYAANSIPQDTITTGLNPYFLTVKPNVTTNYTLTGVSSGSCQGSFSGSASIVVYPRPTVSLSGGGQICQGGMGTDIVFNFTGTSPWTVRYKVNNDTLTATSNVSPLTVPVNPSIGTTYSLVSIMDAHCSDTAVGSVTVFVFTPANAQFLGSASFCDTASTQVMIDFNGTGPFTVEYNINGVPQPSVTTFDDPYIIPVNVNTTTVYQLTGVQSPGCNGSISGGPAVITINYAPTYANLNLNCNNVTGTYVVTFDVLGAAQPLTFVSGNPGTFNGSQWTSAPIPQGLDYSFTFRDANNCGDVTVSGASTCNCVTEVGTMNLMPLSVCQNAVATATYNGGFVDDGDDALLFIVHSNPALPLGTIYGWNNAPTFGLLPGMNPGVTYYISAIAGNLLPSGVVDTSDLCMMVAQGTPVVFQPLPTANLSPANVSVCQGTAVNLSVNFNGTAPFSFSPVFDGVPQTPITGIMTNPFAWTFTPSGSMQVQLTDVADQFCPIGQAAGSSDITVVQPPMVANVQAICDFNTATYTVAFDITTGTPPFNLSGIAGVFLGNTFNSLPIPFTAPDFFAIFTDAGACGQDTVSGMSQCNCMSDAGIMDQTPVSACTSATLSVPAAQGTVLDNDDQLMYILHTLPGVPAGTVLAWSNTPSFTFGGVMQTGITYYVSSIVGNPDGTGQINLSDPCLSVAVGTPVTWLAEPTATLVSGNFSICPGGSQLLLVNLTGTPNFTLTYTNNGNPFTVTATQTTFLLNATLQQTATFVLTEVSDVNCSGTVNGSVTVNVHPAPAASNITANCSPATQTYTVEFDVTQGDFSSLNIAGITGTFDPNTGHFVSNPLPSGQAFSLSISDAWACDTFYYSELVDCACATQAGIMDQTPLTLCYGQTASTSPALGGFLDNNDVLLYFLVGQSNLPPNWTVIETSPIPTFNFNPLTMTPSTQYYIVAVAGNSGGTNGVDLNDPCLSVMLGPPVTWRPEVTAAISGAPEVCPGSNATLEVQFTGEGPFNFTYTDGSSQQTIANVTSNLYGLLVSPSVTIGYTLINVTGAGNCSGTTSGAASVTISNLPQALNVNVACDLTNQTYVLSFDIGNGAQPNPTYIVLGINGTLNDTTFTSVPQPGNQPYTVVIGTPIGCTSSISGMPTCVCATNAGTLASPVNACLPNGTVAAQQATTPTLEPDDILLYVLCTDPSTLPQGIVAQSSTPSFAFQSGMTAGTTYFIVAVAGNNLNGMVDLNDPCVSYSPGVPVVFHFAPSGLLTGDLTRCEGENALFQVQLAGVAPFTLTYAINGVPQAPVTASSSNFNILTNNVQQNQTFTLVSLQDVNCPGTVDGQANLTVNPLPKGSIVGDTTVCAGTPVMLTLVLTGDSSFDLTINGTVPLLQLNGVQNGATFSVSPNVTTTYTIGSLTAAGNNCPVQIGQGATVTTSTISANSTVSDYSGFNVSCPLANDGSIAVVPNGGVPPVTAAWSNGANALTNTNLTAGTYSVTLTDNIGCTSTQIFNLVAPPELDINLETQAPKCFGESNGSMTISGINGGVGPFSISVNGTVWQTTGNFPATYPRLPSGQVLIEVEDVNGCVSDEVATVPSTAELIVDLGPDTTIHLGESLLLSPSISTPNVASFTWSPPMFLQTPDQLFTLSNPAYSVRYTLEVTDTSGCKAKDDLLVIVNREKRVFVPNVIYPGSSNGNDVLRVYGGPELTEVLSMQVYDRWGELLYEAQNFFLSNANSLGWDGKAKGQEVAPGVYVYVLEVRYIDGETEIISGDVTVVR